LIYFCGNDLCSDAISDILDICKDKDFSVNVISKSGTTTEPAIAFRIFSDLLKKKYGSDYYKRVYVTTDKQRGKLKELSDKEGYKTFVVPDDVGGRYSVLTAVGLLPIAAAGIDIDAIMHGAADCREKYLNNSDISSELIGYVSSRNILYNGGKNIEIFASYESALFMTGEWLKQLFGESEGKEGKGIFPAYLTYTTDLHSMGQFAQEGSRTLFETVISVVNSQTELLIPYMEDDSDSLNYLAGKSVHYVNTVARRATTLAHNDGGCPNIILQIDQRDAYNFGQLVYFFELACAVSAYTLGVNPFDQPGVEAYKRNMFVLLGKPGYEK